MQVKQELGVLRTLNHPFVITTNEIAEDLQGYYVLMEYVPGGRCTTNCNAHCTPLVLNDGVR